MPPSFDQFRHGYAGTIYRGQGRTLDQTYLYHSEHWRSASSYVALTRHRDKTALFVARNTAADVKQLARQMGRVDDRRAASMFYHREQIGPVRPLTARELLAKFGGAWARREPAPSEPRFIQDNVQQQGQPEARRAEMRGEDRRHGRSRRTGSGHNSSSRRTTATRLKRRSETTPSAPAHHPRPRAKPIAMSRAGQRQPQRGAAQSLTVKTRTSAIDATCGAQLAGTDLAPSRRCSVRPSRPLHAARRTNQSPPAGAGARVIATCAWPPKPRSGVSHRCHNKRLSAPPSFLPIRSTGSICGMTPNAGEPGDNPDVYRNDLSLRL